MNWRNTLMAALVAVALWHVARQWQMRPIHPADGLIAPADPLQTNLPDAPPIRHGSWLLTPRAHYDITARILSREDYYIDPVSDLIPEDLALGWGAMSDNRILSSFEITQGGRFYFWHAKELPIPLQEVIEHSANTHVIPADAWSQRQLKRLRVGQVVHLTGVLVDGVRDDGMWIHTSLTRSDTGAGSCEVMLVEQVETL
jgi:hypothetical protein